MYLPTFQEVVPAFSPRALRWVMGTKNQPPTTKPTMTKTLTSCLKDLDITDAAVFADCENTDEEFKAIKKNWRTKVLAEHPVRDVIFCCCNCRKSTFFVFFFLTSYSP